MYPVLKHVLDMIISGSAIVILSPILLLIAIMIKVDSKGPVLFKGTSKNTSRASRASNLSLIYSLFLVNFCL